MQKKVANRKYIFDTKQVKYLTYDALMYILAIVYNIRNNRVYRFKFEGNMPDDNKARKLFEDSGFLKYVNSNVRKVTPRTNKLQILSGKNTDNDSAGKIVDFASQINIPDKGRKLKALYRVIIELMSNTTNHAYHEKGIMEKNWYVFGEHKTNFTRFVFLDTGQGIPATMRRKGFREIVGLENDQSLIMAAFTERFRSQTRHSNRGHGLPGTYAICKQSLISNFTVRSGRGKCLIGAEEEMLEGTTEKLYGTMYYWEIR